MVKKRVRGSRTGRPIMVLLDLLGRRWALRLIWELREEPKRFRALQESIGASPTIINTRLSELREAKLVEQAWHAWGSGKYPYDERKYFVLDESLAGMCVDHLSSEDALVALDYWRVRTIQSVDEIVQRAKADVAAKADA